MDTSKMSVVELRGAPLARGQAHGEALRGQIAEVTDRFRAQFDRIAYGNGAARPMTNPEEFMKGFIAASGFERSTDRWTPGLMDEVRGIAQGARQPLEIIQALNLIDEIWSFTARTERQLALEKCSAFGIVGERGSVTYSGQNMDIGTWLEGLQSLLKIHHADGGLAHVFAYAGCIGLTGMNSARLSMSCNSLTSLNSNSTGVPVTCVLRRFLEHGSFDEAVTFVRTVPHASGQNYVVAAPGVVRSFECSANKVVEFEPDPAHRRVCHTNHPLANDDVGPGAPTPSASTHARMASINARLGRPGVAASLEDIKAALSARDDPSYPVSRMGDVRDRLIGYTIGSCIYDLGEKPQLHIAAGPPCQTAWKTFEAGAF